jgi:carbonic anhydrase/acetyltransferase-like protein (isoleucine patch superfamily)
MNTEQKAGGIVLTLGSHKPAISERAWVAPTATVAGAVTLDDDVSIWYGTSVRADAEPILVGSGTNIQDNCVIHTDPGMPATIGKSVTVGHGAILHGCRIEDGVLIGMGAIVMNGAVIGAGSLLAAGVVIAEGTVIPAGSLVAGVPGKIKRALDLKAIEANRTNAHHYIQLAREHQDALRSRYTRIPIG